MTDEESLRIHLPKFLSTESLKDAIQAIRDFPDSLDQRFYTKRLLGEAAVFQGDGIRGMPYHDFRQGKTKMVTAMILSNTCDIDPANQRFVPPSITYAPIFPLSAYRTILSESGALRADQVEGKITGLQSQEVTNRLYLPAYEGLPPSVVLLDRIMSCPNTYLDREALQEQRLFVLSDYGAFLLALKLSIHFCRFQDKVDRGAV